LTPIGISGRHSRLIGIEAAAASEVIEPSCALLVRDARIEAVQRVDMGCPGYPGRIMGDLLPGRGLLPKERESALRLLELSPQFSDDALLLPNDVGLSAWKRHEGSLMMI
jgi:hypothetical protein